MKKIEPAKDFCEIQFGRDGEIINSNKPGVMKKYERRIKRFEKTKGKVRHKSRKESLEESW